jgi:hypothetical protein
MRRCSCFRSPACPGIAAGRLKRVTVVAVLLASVFAPAAALARPPAAATRPVAAAPQLLAFRGFHFSGGGGFGRRHVGIGRFGRRGSSQTLRRLAHALALAYLLHLFFSHGGLSIVLWLLVIGLIVHLIRRRRTRRYV